MALRHGHSPNAFSNTSLTRKNPKRLPDKHLLGFEKGRRINLHHYIAISSKKQAEIYECPNPVRIKGKRKDGSPYDFLRLCQSDYCPFCGLPKAKRRVKKLVTAHRSYPNHVLVTLTYGNCEDYELQSQAYERLKRKMHEKDQAALFERVFQWKRGLRHIHFVVSSNFYYSHKRIRNWKKQIFAELSLPSPRESTCSSRRDKPVEDQLAYIYRSTYKKPRWKPDEYPPAGELRSLTRMRHRQRKKGCLPWSPSMIVESISHVA